jgi:copper(I)-binding protein
MLTSTRRRLAAAMVLLVPLLGACGFGYQTDQVYQAGVGVNDRSGTVDVLATVVVSTREGQGTLVASLVNKGDSSDSLTGVTGEGIQGEVAKPVEVPAGQLVNLADTGAISLSGTSLKSGYSVRLTLEFESGQRTELDVPVVPFAGDYSTITPANPAESPAS